MTLLCYTFPCTIVIIIIIVEDSVSVINRLAEEESLEVM